MNDATWFCLVIEVLSWVAIAHILRTEGVKWLRKQLLVPVWPVGVNSISMYFVPDRV